MSTTVTEQVAIPTGTWSVDPAHSIVEFRIKDLRTIAGRFTEFDGTIEAGEQLEDLRASGLIKVGSLTTHQPQPDAHLRSADFFDAERFPEIRFETLGVEPLGDNRFTIGGRLTIKETPLDVRLEAKTRGPGEDDYGNQRLAVETAGVIEWGDTTVEIVADVSATKSD